MCLDFDKTRGRDSISNPVFFPNYTGAKNYALKTARIFEFGTQWTPRRTYIAYVKIFELPFGMHVVIDDSDHDYGHYEMYQNHLETVYDPQTTAAMLIQKRWREIYNRRFVAAVIIKRELRKAIANPYTQLCKRRLVREFNEM